MTLLATQQVPEQQTNYHFSHTVTTQADAARIWKIWTDVGKWYTWDKGLRSATLEGPFTENAKGRLISDKGNRSSFRIVDIAQGRSYTMKTRIPFGWLIIRRTMEVKEGITSFTHIVAFTGPFKKAFGRSYGERYRAMLPEVMEEIRKIAEKNEGR